MRFSAFSYLIRLVLSIALFTSALSVIADEEEGIAADYEIKAAFIYNFPSFIVWPESAFKSSDADFMVCGLGIDDRRFKKALERALSGAQVGEHQMIFDDEVTVEEAKNSCHLVFVGSSEQKHFETINQQLNNLSILLVSDGTDYLERGGMIRLYRKGPNIRIQLHNCILKKAGLVADPHFLDLVEIYENKSMCR